jgi:CRP-like cAMP-binding protein
MPAFPPTCGVSVVEPPIFYIVSGEVEIVEIKETFGKGTLLGEIGLFTPDGRRIMTVRCKTDVQTAIIDYDQFNVHARW